jgi:hypothetical protein
VVAGEEAGICRTPVDALLDAVESAISLGVRELCCRLGIAGTSFARSTENLSKAAGLRMSEEIYRQVVESEGQAVIQAQREERLPIEWSAAQCQTQTPQGREVSRVYASCDGVLVPMTTQAEKDKRRQSVQKQRQERPRKKGVRRARLAAVKKGMDQRYKQLYLTSFYDQTKEHRLVGVTRGDHEAMGNLLRKQAALIRLAAADERVGLVDGATCLKPPMEDLNLTALGLDFCHLADHVAAVDREPGATAARPAAGAEVPAADEPAAPVGVGAKTPVLAQSSAWTRDVLHTVKHEGYEPFWEKLLAMRHGRRGRRRQAADKLLHYVAPRKDMIAYDEFLRQGWDIGTGPMEAQCKATTRRIKGSGMRWDAANAEALVGLEALYQSHMWDSWWTKTRCAMGSNGIPK